MAPLPPTVSPAKALRGPGSRSGTPRSGLGVMPGGAPTGRFCCQSLPLFVCRERENASNSLLPTSRGRITGRPKSGEPLRFSGGPSRNCRRSAVHPGRPRPVLSISLTQQAPVVSDDYARRTSRGRWPAQRFLPLGFNPQEADLRHPSATMHEPSWRAGRYRATH